MAFSLYDAAKISRNPLTRGVFLGVAVSNELFARLAFVPKAGDAWGYDREKALPSIEFVDPANPTTAESSATFDKVTATMRLIDSDIDVLNSTLNMTDPNGDPWAMQMQLKLKALGMKLADKLFTGVYVTSATFAGSAALAALAFVAASAHTDSSRNQGGTIRYTHAGTLWAYRAPGDRAFGPDVAVSSNSTGTVLVSDNPNKTITLAITVASATANGEINVYFSSTTNEYDSVAKLCAPSQVIPSTNTNGDPLSLDVLDDLLYNKIKIKTDLAYFMNGKLKKKFMALARSASGGLMPDQLKLPVLGMDGREAAINVPHYNGIPIFQVDDIPSTEAKGSASTLSSVYLASLTPEQGLYYGVQQAQTIEALSHMSPYDAQIGGVRLYDIGQLEGKAAARKRVEWMGCPALGSQYALARASELITL